ncbi:unnamed protein product [Cercopithifilaria johnstoni]|uniref:ZP domain-containing protein n=1 Tax=Cercopithifilaria johnstoni TaxID=2874296 RepID=A0A8J2M812_9BILA|nr:unnamed protein product [Cercopithifilaria johnstoni]
MNKNSCKLLLNLACFFCLLIRSVIMQQQNLPLFITLFPQWVWMLERQPVLECFTNGLRLYFQPEAEFNGHVYVRGFFMSENCHLDYTRNPTANPFYFEIFYNGPCDVKCETQEKPQGKKYSIIVIVQHHYLFLTQMDRAYDVNCFYQISDNLAHEVAING